MMRWRPLTSPCLIMLCEMSLIYTRGVRHTCTRGKRFLHTFIISMKENKWSRQFKTLEFLNGALQRLVCINFAKGSLRAVFSQVIQVIKDITQLKNKNSLRCYTWFDDLFLHIISVEQNSVHSVQIMHLGGNEKETETIVRKILKIIRY